MSSVVVVNYGMGNLKSVCRALEYVGARVSLSDCPKVIGKAERLILPGVGAFDTGIKEMQVRQIDVALQMFKTTQRPLLGICLGMQMLLGQSEEFGCHEGLGFIPGVVKRIPRSNGVGEKLKVPHVGWSNLASSGPSGNWRGSIMEGVQADDYFYFVHSFMAIPTRREHQVAHCEYQGIEITACIQKNNIIGCQFHPEKSAAQGLKILDRFLKV